VIGALERWRPVEPVTDRAAVRVDILYTLIHRLGAGGAGAADHRAEGAWPVFCHAARTPALRRGRVHAPMNLWIP
jgi:hypothetical protein